VGRPGAPLEHVSACGQGAAFLESHRSRAQLSSMGIKREAAPPFPSLEKNLGKLTNIEKKYLGYLD
jgi:hypothetical protein